MYLLVSSIDDVDTIFFTEIHYKNELRSKALTKEGKRGHQRPRSTEQSQGKRRQMEEEVEREGHLDKESAIKKPN